MTDLTVTGAPGVLGTPGGPGPSAVELFERWWDLLEGPATLTEGRAATYRSLLPAEAPGPGRQYRFEVDLDRCTGCKACVTACHSLNGLDEGEAWRSVGVLCGGGSPRSGAGATSPEAAPVWSQHVTTACHHCVEPACLAGCPVDAYEKDPVTGIVAHLDDQCIGCRYCMLTCPYEVPSYNSRLGIVRKCDMCSHRLAEGEPPACVQGCPTAAISIGLADISELAASHEDDPAGRLVPTAPKSRLTSPTTRYRTERPVPTDAVAGDEHRLSPSHNHPPLVAMLVLTQVSVGAVAVAMAGSRLGGWFGEPGRLGAGPAVLAFATAMVAMGAAVLHLGRPLMAWRAVLGVRHSWLSREILAFGAYAGLAGAAAACALGALPRSWEGGLGVATVAAGALGLWSSACLYSVTGHPLWRIDRVAARFGATALVGGSAAVAAVASTAVAADPVATTRVDHAAIGRAAALAVAIGVISMLATAAAFLWRHRDSRNALGRSAHLMNHQLAGRVRLAAALGLATICLAAVAGLGPDTGSGVTALLWVGALLGAVGAAWVERGLFFTADAPDRMPGGSR